MNTLCGKTVLPHKDSDDAGAAHVEEGVKIKPVTVGTQIVASPDKIMSSQMCLTDQQSSSWTRRARVSP